MRTTATSFSRTVLSSCLAAATHTLVSATKTHPPTPSNFVAFPSSRPTSVPTSKPSYGPASMTVVEEIMGGVLGGVIFLIFTYFLFGYYLYVSDMDAYEKAMEDKEQQDAEAEADESGGHRESGATVDDASDDEVLSPLQPTKPPPSTGPTSASNLSNRRLAMPPGQYFKGDDLPRPPQRGLGYLTPASSEERSDAALMRPRPPSQKADGLAGGGAAGDVESSGGHEARPLLGGAE